MPVKELGLGTLAHGVNAQQDLLQQFRCVELMTAPVVLFVLLLNQLVEIGEDGVILGFQAAEVRVVADAPPGVQLAHHDFDCVNMAVGKVLVGPEEIF